ncbi:MAG: carboxypeptidase-like regulatory domain-containing protein [Nonlabens sp.]
MRYTTYIGKILIAFSVLLSGYSLSAQEKIEVSGTVIDEFNDPVPYAAVGVPAKYLGTSTNDEGQFTLSVAQENLTDVLEISSIGYETFKIQIQEFINRENKVIQLKEVVTSLDEVVIKDPSDYAKDALKKVRKNTLSSRHQINMLYRRFSVENGNTRFMVEHYLNLIDYGPSDIRIDEVGLAEARKSADYRFAFKKQPVHAVHIMAQVNPLRQDIRERDYRWEKVGGSSYDGEDIIIIQGFKKDLNKAQSKHAGKNWIKFYVGMDTYAIYKIEVSRFATPFANLNAFYIYKKDADGKLVLNYHNREAKFRTKISDIKKQQLGIKNNFVDSAYRHEGIVLDIVTDRKKIDVRNPIYEKMDIGDYNVPYNPNFWKNISLPPETKFYKKSVKELESIFNVSLDAQFNAVNK